MVQQSSVPSGELLKQKPGESYESMLRRQMAKKKGTPFYHLKWKKWWGVITILACLVALFNVFFALWMASHQYTLSPVASWVWVGTFFGSVVLVLVAMNRASHHVRKVLAKL